MTNKEFYNLFSSYTQDRENTLVKYREYLLDSLPEMLGQINIETQFIPVQLRDMQDNPPDSVEISIESALDENQRIFIIGEAGSGKTTLLKYLTFGSAKGLFANISNVPVIINASDLLYPFDLSKSIHELIKRISGKELKYNDLEKLLKMGRFLILLDGINESLQTNELIRSFNEFVNRYPNNHYIVTSRPFPEHLNLTDFRTYRIAEMNDASIRINIDNLSSDYPVVAEMCWNTIQENPVLKSLARNPVHLRLIVESCKESPKLSHVSITETYLKGFLPALLRKLPTSAKQLAQTLALYMYRHDLMIISHEEIQNLENHFEQFSLQSDLDALQKYGLLVVSQLRTYHFVHQVVQEYFCVQELISLDFLEVKDIINEHIGDEKWEQVFTVLLAERPERKSLISEFITGDDKNRWLLGAKILLEGEKTDQSTYRRAIQNLCSLLNQDTPQTTIRATNYLFKFRDPDISEICSNWLLRKSDDPLSTASLVFILVSKGQRNAEILSLLLPQIKNENSKVRYQTCRALSIIDTKQSTELLIDCLKQENNTEVREQIFSALIKTKRMTQIQSTDLAQLMAILIKLNKNSESLDEKSWSKLVFHKINTEIAASEVK